MDTEPIPTGGPTAPSPVATSAAPRSPRWVAVLAVLGTVLGALALLGLIATVTVAPRMLVAGARGGPAAFGMPDHGGFPGGGPMHRDGRRDGWRDGDGDGRMLERFAERRDERVAALAEALGVPVADVEAARDAVIGRIPALRDEVADLEDGERRAALRELVQDALASELGITRAELDAAIVEARDR